MSYELHVLRAAADGVQPALLLRAPGKKAEYLFNVPDGFSRLAMEQKLTPSARLSCVLLTDLLPASTGGLGALLLRLRHDGHGQTQLIGPHGSSSITHSLRHICRWQHPKVFVSECCENRPMPVFEDEHVVIVPLLAGDRSTGCPWCLYSPSERPTANTQKAAPLASPSELHDDSSSSDSLGSGSSMSSDDTMSSGFVPSSLDGDGDSFEKSLSAFNACSETGNGTLQFDERFDNPVKLNFHEINGASVDGRIQREDRDVEKQSPNVMPQQRKRHVDAGECPLLDFDECFSELVKLKKRKAAEHGFGKVGSGGSNSGSATNFSLRHDNEGSDLLKDTTSEDGIPKVIGMQEPKAVLPASSHGAVLLKSSFVQSTKPYEWLISNSLHADLPKLADDSNPVYGCHPSSQATMISGVATVDDGKFNEAGDNGSYERNRARVLGYVSFLRKANTALLVVECTGTNDLDSLRRHPALSCLYSNSDSKNDDETNICSKIHVISAIVHLTPHNLLQSCDYQSWMCSMGSPVHVVMNEISPEFGFQSSLAVIQRLNNIHQDIFPLPFNMYSNSGHTRLTGELMNCNGRVVDARSSMCLAICEKETTLSHTPVEHSVPLGLEKIGSEAEASEREPEVLSPKAAGLRLNASVCSHLSPNALAASLIKRRLLQQKATALSPCISGLNPYGDDTCEDGEKEMAAQVGLNDSKPMSLITVQEHKKVQDPISEFQLTFLGTGCAEPSKNRGSSSILLQVRGAQGAMLLDAGEGATGQLFRRFGAHAAKAIISSLQCIWLSHKHGDHVLGVLSILQTRSSQAPPLLIIGPHKVHQWLSEVHGTSTARGYPFPRFTFIHCDELSDSEPHKNNYQQLLDALDAMQLKSMFSVKVFHCHDAYGIILNGRQGWKVVYSGDTRPCKQLIEAGQGCTLLIHEATFEDRLIEQAKCKRHSTVSEAVQVGWQMRACHIILTHFSQRYPEMVTVDSDRNENLSVAFDGMVVASNLLGSLGRLLPQIRIACQKTVNVSPTKEIGDRRIESTSKAMPIWHDESPVQQRSVREPLVAKHKRWLSDSDDEAADQCTSLRWSSDSDEEAAFIEQGSPLLRNGSRNHRVVDGFLKRNSCEAGCGTTFDSFKGMGGTGFLQRVRIQEYFQGEGRSSNTQETAGPLGGKHIRWIDYDSEDG